MVNTESYILFERRRREIFAIYTVYTMDLYWIQGAAGENFEHLQGSEIIGSYYFLHVTENRRFLLLVSNPPKFV